MCCTDAGAVPWVVWGFFKLITPFIDPLTRQKLNFNEDMRQYVPDQELWTEFGGKLDFEYDHETYWPALRKLCEEKRAFRKQRWVEGGSHIGEHEDYLAGGKETGVAGTIRQGEGKKDDEAAAPAAAAVPAAAEPAPTAIAAGSSGTEAGSTGAGAGSTGALDEGEEKKEEKVAAAPQPVAEGAPGVGGEKDVADAVLNAA